MLIIRRKQGECILIGESIRVRVVELSPGRVKIGIEAPPEVLILREEIRIAGEQNMAAARGATVANVRRLLAGFGIASRESASKTHRPLR
jgi:carbon storage regulator